MAYFPIFINMEGKTVLVIGAGTIATRRIQTMLNFGCKIIVIAPKASDVIKEYASSGHLTWLCKAYQEGDCLEADYVLAATNSRSINKQIHDEAVLAGCMVNVCDKKEECDFYFPAVVTKNEFVIGMTASGKNHKLLKQLREFVEKKLEDFNMGGRCEDKTKNR